MTIDLSSFKEMEFPKHGNIVYILCYILNEGSPPIPFYVGESSRHVGRFGDYISGKFSASTDFKVGEAVKHFIKKGFRVVVKFNEVKNRKEEEKRILKILKSNFRLLNDLEGYAYKTSLEKKERLRIQQFVDEILDSPNGNGQKSKLS
jgi:hypothetical protein